jgi:hypothetical protein
MRQQQLGSRPSYAHFEGFAVRNSAGSLAILAAMRSGAGLHEWASRRLRKERPPACDGGPSLFVLMRRFAHHGAHHDDGDGLALSVLVFGLASGAM